MILRKKSKFCCNDTIASKEGYNYTVITKGNRIKKIILLIEPKNPKEKYSKMVYTRKNSINSSFNMAVENAFMFILKNDIEEYINLARTIKDSNSIFSKNAIKLYLNHRGIGHKTKTYSVVDESNGLFTELYINKEGQVASILFVKKDNTKIMVYPGGNDFKLKLHYFFNRCKLKDLDKFKQLLYDIELTDLDSFNIAMEELRYGLH